MSYFIPCLTSITAHLKTPYLKNACRYLFLSVASIFAFLTIGYLTPTKSCHSAQKSCPLSICVTNTGIHTNIIVPIENKLFNWKNYLKADDIKNNPINNFNYLSFGWGDRAFYLQTPTLADLNVVTTFNALFLPTSSLMDVQWYPTIPEQIEIKCVKISENDYLKLINFIKDSFKLDPVGKTIRISNGYSPYSGFYEAKGNYSIFRNCNSWTAEGLSKAKVNTPVWASLSSAIMLHLKNSCECKQ